ncbi:MAG TPA: multidrug efflux RND transporter permease subunit [Aestuariivirgaceae bacterium]|jgi:multidrug efflux pump
MASFTDIFVRRPVLASVVSLIILLVGLQAVWKLPLRQFPEITKTTITITTGYPGANADQIKGFITTPIQQAVASAEGIDTLTSSSAQNVSTVTLNLKLDADGDRATSDVLSKVNQVRGILPREANDPIVTRTTGEGFALMYIGFNSDVMSSSQISDYLNRVVQPKLQSISGVANAEILGGQTFAMRVWLDPDRMAALGVTPLDVSQALQANNFTTAAGEVKGNYVQTNINAQTSLSSVEGFENLVVVTRGETLIRLGQIARIELGPENFNSSSSFDGLKAVFIGVYATPSANPLTVISDVRAAMPSIEAEMPVGLKAAIAYDATTFIRESIKEVATTLGQAAIIVVIVIFLFLGSIRSTIIPIVTIPLSLIGVMIALLALGYSINLLTLLALVLAIGLVVDDAIVVVENIHRHMEEGMDRFSAAVQGAREIAVPVISMTITLAAVYAPIGFTTGLTGSLFREFAFTLAGAVVVSGVIALTLSPMMCSKLLKFDKENGRFAHFLDRMFESIKRRYQKRLHNSLNYRPATIFLLVCVLIATALTYQTTRRELAPEEDQGVLFALVNAPQHTNLNYLELYMNEVGKVLRSLPESEHYFGIMGFQGVHSGFGGVLFHPWDERKRNLQQLMQDLQPKISQVPGVQAFLFAPPSLPGSSGGPPFQFVLTSSRDHRELAEVLDKINQEAQKSGLFLFTDGDLRFDTPQVEVKIDRDKANQAGVTMEDVGTTLATLLSGNYVNRFNLEGRSYQVVPQVPRDFREDPNWLLKYEVRTRSGDMVPLSNFATLERTVQPTSLNTFQQLNSASITGVPFPGRSMGEAVEFMKTKAAELLPEGMSYDWGGEARQYVQEGNTLAVTFFFALVVIYLVLAAQFESFRDPFIVLVALPTAMFGALLPMNLGAASVNIYTQIGLVTLIGLISKHGILMVEFANRLQEEEGLDRRAAIEKAAAVRLRPILMTTAAMVVGMLPLLIAQGAGAKSRFDIGLVIAGGMSVGTMFTLFITPAVYIYVARDRRKMVRMRAVSREKGKGGLAEAAE